MQWHMRTQWWTWGHGNPRNPNFLEEKRKRERRGKGIETEKRALGHQREFRNSLYSTRFVTLKHVKLALWLGSLVGPTVGFYVFSIGLSANSPIWICPTKHSYRWGEGVKNLSVRQTNLSSFWSVPSVKASTAYQLKELGAPLQFWDLCPRPQVSCYKIYYPCSLLMLWLFF